jgi:hypothetical protein
MSIGRLRQGGSAPRRVWTWSKDLTEPEPKVVAFPGAAGGMSKLDGGALAALLGGRIRGLRRVCGAMLGGVVLLAAASFVVVRVVAVPQAASTSLSLVLTFLAMLLILVTSRLQASILRRTGRGAAASDPSARGAAASDPAPAPLPAVAAGMLAAYARATRISFALLAAAAALGLVVAAVTGTVRYALVICAAAALGMLARWPRHSAVVWLLRRRGLA